MWQNNVVGILSKTTFPLFRRHDPHYRREQEEIVCTFHFINCKVHTNSKQRYDHTRTYHRQRIIITFTEPVRKICGGDVACIACTFFFARIKELASNITLVLISGHLKVCWCQVDPQGSWHKHVLSLDVLDYSCTFFGACLNASMRVPDFMLFSVFKAGSCNRVI